MLLDEVREEEEFQDNEDDKKLDAKNQPQRASEGHRTETIVVEMECTIKKSVGAHRLGLKFRGKVTNNFVKPPNYSA